MINDLVNGLVDLIDHWLRTYALEAFKDCFDYPKDVVKKITLRAIHEYPHQPT